MWQFHKKKFITDVYITRTPQINTMFKTNQSIILNVFLLLFRFIFMNAQLYYIV